jgi:hypothetical protein
MDFKYEDYAWDILVPVMRPQFRVQYAVPMSLKARYWRSAADQTRALNGKGVATTSWFLPATDPQWNGLMEWRDVPFLKRMKYYMLPWWKR